jgi:hypothetical protein
MVSHGNITAATLSIMVNSMEMAKTQPVCISSDATFFVLLTPCQPVWNTPDGLQVIFNVLPLYHSIGLYRTSFFNFFNPSTTVMLPKWDIDIFFDNIPK